MTENVLIIKREGIISELHTEDKEEIYYLPSKPYSCIRYEVLKGDKQGFVNVNHKKYSTSPRFAKQSVYVGITHDRIYIFQNEEVLASHQRLYGEEPESMDWIPYLSLMAKRPTAIKYTSFYDRLPHEWGNYFDECTIQEKKKALRLLATIMKDQQLEKATRALKVASERGHPSAEAIKQVYHQMIHGREYRSTVSVPHNLPTMPNAHRGIRQYDAFFTPKGVKGHA